jgi:hypothetical protein
MKALIILFVINWIWIIYEVINAPLMDDDGNIIEEEK